MLHEQGTVRIENGGFGLKLTALYKSKTCHSMADGAQLIHGRRDVLPQPPLSLTQTHLYQPMTHLYSAGI